MLTSAAWITASMAQQQVFDLFRRSSRRRG
jgi:hypothetical protein